MLHCYGLYVYYVSGGCTEFLTIHACKCIIDVNGIRSGNVQQQRASCWYVSVEKKPVGVLYVHRDGLMCFVFFSLPLLRVHIILYVHVIVRRVVRRGVWFNARAYDIKIIPRLLAAFLLLTSYHYYVYFYFFLSFRDENTLKISGPCRSRGPIGSLKFRLVVGFVFIIINIIIQCW